MAKEGRQRRKDWNCISLFIGSGFEKAGKYVDEGKGRIMYFIVSRLFDDSYSFPIYDIPSSNIKQAATYGNRLGSFYRLLYVQVNFLLLAKY